MDGQGLCIDLLSKISKGHIHLILPSNETFDFGDKTKAIKLEIKNKNTFDRWIKEGSLGVGESYMENWWETDNLTNLLQILINNNLDQKIKGDIKLGIKFLWTKYANKNTLTGSKKNIKHHYDLGNEFYKLMLDKTMTYSCGFQQKPKDTLEKMQIQKYERICKKLQLKKGETLVDIGCGWGGMLFYAAKKYGIKGVGITLSKEQHKYATKLITKQKIKNVEIKLQDYRETEGTFNKLVSIGMFEHVGTANYQEFFKKCESLLKEKGIGLLHTIGTANLKGGQDPWIMKYIFPGGQLPKLSQICKPLEEQKLLIADVENWKNHYALTLHKWHKNFTKNINKIEYDNKFKRMWNFYLQSCEATFLSGNTQLFQILFTKGKKWQLPLVRIV